MAAHACCRFDPGTVGEAWALHNLWDCSSPKRGGEQSRAIYDGDEEDCLEESVCVQVQCTAQYCVAASA